MSDWQDGQGTMSDWQEPEGEEEDAPAPSRMEARAAAKRARTRRLHIALGTLAVAIVAGGAVLAWQLLTPGPTAPAPARVSAAPAPSSASPAPVGLKASKVSSSRVKLAWSPVAAGSAVTYQVYRDGKAIGTSTKASFSDATVRPSRTYTYAVSALTAAGQPGTLSSAVKVTTPRKPRPAPESGPAGAANTGFQNAPGYPGHLTDCGNVTVQSNSTYKYCDFSSGLAIGNGVVNVTFLGCRFASNAVEDANVADYGDGIKFLYDTFEPSTVPPGPGPTSGQAPDIANGQGYQYGIDQRADGSLTVDHSDFWGFAEAMQIGHSSQSKPVIVSNSWIHNPRNPGSSDHTDGILENYGGLSYMTFDHNTFVGDGNTNALALQGQHYDHITITRNYFSGYGYMVNSGANGSSTNMVFTDNVWGSDIKPVFGPLYGNTMYTTPGLGGVWHGNTIRVAPGTSWMAAGNNGLFWWPTDGNPSPGQIIGHSSDYPGP
jgi:hypothetical protein